MTTDDRDATTAARVIEPTTEDLRIAVLELGSATDLGACPYFLRNGEEGAHGPNTCIFGCSDEPECETCCPTTGWPYAIALRMTPSNLAGAR